MFDFFASLIYIVIYMKIFCGSLTFIIQLFKETSDFKICQQQQTYLIVVVACNGIFQNREGSYLLFTLIKQFFDSCKTKKSLTGPLSLSLPVSTTFLPYFYVNQSEFKHDFFIKSQESTIIFHSFTLILSLSHLYPTHQHLHKSANIASLADPFYLVKNQKSKIKKINNRNHGIFRKTINFQVVVIDDNYYKFVSIKIYNSNNNTEI